MKWYENKLINKLFLVTCDWNVAWKAKDNNIYNVIDNPKGYWLADPLLFETEKDIFLFVEGFEKKKEIGRLGVMRFDGQNFVDFTIIIEQLYHLSYPYVFIYNNEFYMIPESSDNKTIELYYSKEFPEKWEKVAELVQGKYVDTTVDLLGDNIFELYTYDIWTNEICVGKLDMENLELDLAERIKDKNYMFRNGGNIFEHNNCKYRAVQNNNFFYGQSVRVIDCATNREIFEMNPETIQTNTNKKYRRLHTYSCTSNMEAVDLSDIRFDFFKCFRKADRIYKLGRQRE